MTPEVLGAAGGVLLAVAAVAALVDWVAVARAWVTVERLAKPAVLGALLVAVAVAPDGGSPVRLLLIAALAASLAGDWFLLPPGRFVAGLAAFLVAHLAYLGVFVAIGGLGLPAAIVGLAVAVVVLVGAGRPIARGAATAGLGAPVLAYLGAISTMAVTATASGSVPAALGAWLFVASDAILGWDRFAAAPAATPAVAARRRLAVIVTYHFAQGLLVLALIGPTAALPA